MSLHWLDEIEAQLDSTAPYYVPRLIAALRDAASALEAQDTDMDILRQERDGQARAALREYARANKAEAHLAAHDAARPDDLGLSIDMLDVDRLREWARLLLVHGADIGHWGSVPFVAGKMQTIATGIEKAVKDIGMLRAEYEAAERGLADWQARVRVLEQAVGNCFMMAKREISRLLNMSNYDAKSLERWQHVQRFCETTGSKSSILRGQLPDELTEGSEGGK